MIAWERPRCEAELGSKLKFELGQAIRFVECS
jgi:hypothetical protein